MVIGHQPSRKERAVVVLPRWQRAQPVPRGDGGSYGATFALKIIRGSKLPPLEVGQGGQVIAAERALGRNVEESRKSGPCWLEEEYNERIISVAW